MVVIVSLLYLFSPKKKSVLQNKQMLRDSLKSSWDKMQFDDDQQKITSKKILKNEAKARFGRVKRSCSCRITSSWLPLYFYYNNFCMTVAGPLIFKAEVKVASCSLTGSPPYPSSTMPHKNIRSQIKTERLKSSKITSLASVCLVLKIAFNLLKMER